MGQVERDGTSRGPSTQKRVIETVNQRRKTVNRVGRKL